MRRDDVIFQVTWRGLSRAVLALLLVGVILLAVLPLRAQKSQEVFKDKFRIAYDQGGVGVATSADGRHVYVGGKFGVVVSDDYGKTGSWVQTLRLK